MSGRRARGIAALLMIAAATSSAQAQTAPEEEGRAALLEALADITVDAVDESHTVIDGDWLIWNPWERYPKDVQSAIRSYHVVSADEWTHRYSHVWQMDSTGLLILKDGTRIRWLMRPGGLACLRYPDGRWLYLAREIQTWPWHDHQPLPWTPTSDRSPWLSAPKEHDPRHQSSAGEHEHP